VSRRAGTLLPALFILLLNLWLNAPLFMAGELPFRGSVEGGYVSMSRFLSQHPNPWGWNPLPYCGLPVQFMYVPAMPYLTALGIHLLPHVTPDRIFRTIVSFNTCLGPVTLYFFGLYFTGRRRWALAAALAYSFVSPSYGLFPAIEKDRGIAQLPWRVQVLGKYGEGPHNTGLMLLPMALLALFRAGKGRGYPPILLAAVLLAAIPLTNWVAAFALAISCLVLLLAAWGEAEFRTWRALAAAALAWLLACFWLTPSFIKVIFFNWPVDSFAYQLGNQQARAIAGMVAGALVVRALFHFLGGSFYLRLVTLGVFVFGWISTVYYVYGIDTIPESRRYAIEFEFFFALAIMEALRLAVNQANQTVRLCAYCSGGLLLLVGLPQLFSEAKQGWQAWLPVAPERTIEYRLARWLEDRKPVGRVFASGGLRFRLNSWFDIQQVGGGFETGLQNRMPVELAYRIRAASNLWKGHETEDTLLELKALGTQYVVVHGAASREYYRDFVRPERMAASLPAALHVEDDTIYELPGRPLAHLMLPEEIPSVDPREHPEVLVKYVGAMEDAARPSLRSRWDDPSTFTMEGPVPEGHLIAVQVNDDRGWRATQDGRRIEITQDALGFVVLHPSPAAASRIELQYWGTLEQRLMAALCGVSWMVALFAFFRVRRA
jgi:hypothetical protein